jgi:RhtB (resistance to homoserine/threonine) family protein
MIDLSTLLAYITACTAIILAPGPAQALVLARTLSDGRKAGLMTALGLNVGTLFHSITAALGLSAILATSALAFSVVKYIGAAYLIYLGIQALRHNATTDAPATDSGRQAFSKAVLTGILNPKVAIFFLAFLPQFIDPSRGNVIGQFLLLGGILAGLDVLYECLLVLIIHRTSAWITGHPRFEVWRSRVTGGVLIGLGVRLALAEQK